jgi:hypothetical protein
MRSSFIKRTVIILFLGLSIIAFPVLKVQALSNSFESEHFNISYQEGVDLLNVAHKIEIDSFFTKQDGANTPEEILAFNVENLYDEVSDILDMHLYSYKGNVAIYLNGKELKQALYDRFMRELDYLAIYHSEGNTIYISEEGLRVGILAHEMAHAIIDHYFVVKPPIRIQEVLAGFVEYNIRKKLKGK